MYFSPTALPQATGTLLRALYSLGLRKFIGISPVAGTKLREHLNLGDGGVLLVERWRHRLDVYKEESVVVVTLGNHLGHLLDRAKVCVCGCVLCVLVRVCVDLNLLRRNLLMNASRHRPGVFRRFASAFAI